MRLFTPVIALGFAAAAPASAAQLIVSGSWTNIGFGSIQRFDPTLGTLTGVTVEMTANVGGGWTQNGFGSPYVVDGMLSGTLGTNIGSVSYSGGARTSTSRTEDFWVNATGHSTTHIASSGFAQFVGAGGLLITPAGGTLPAFAFTDVEGMGWVSRAQTSRVISADIRVFYDYAVAAVTPVPEPAAWAMMIGGFGLVGLAMRRRVGGAEKIAT